MKIGYVRVSTENQNTARQEVLMEELKVDKIYIEKCSGKDLNRPQLQEMLEFVREGDSVIVESISRFARNTKDLLDLVDKLTSKQVNFISKKESIDTTTPTGQFMLTVFGGIAALERQSLLLRQQEGIAIAKKLGKYKGRQKIINPQFKEVYEKWIRNEISAKVAMDILGMKRNTFYRRVQEYK